jgi:hypothetical protein
LRKYLQKLLGALTAILLAGVGSFAQNVPDKVVKTPWANIRGVNYVPSYGKNLYEIWHDFDRDAFDRELALAKKVGYNSVRLWLSYFAYRERGRKMVDDVKVALNLCSKHNLNAIIVLFDGCGATPTPNARTMTVSEAYDYLLRSPRLSEKLKQIVRLNYGNYAKGLGRDIEVKISDEGSPHALLWQNWQPSPGYDKLGQDSWPQLDRYVRDIVGSLAGNDRVLAWDIMNEPEWATEEPFTKGLNIPEVKERVANFLQHIRDVIKKDHPNEVVTIGFASLEYCKEFGRLADVLSFHVYGEPSVLETAFKEASTFSLKVSKPVIITETLANFAFMPFEIESLATDEGQLRHYQRTVPTLLKSPIGWMAWGLVVGRIFNPYCDIFYANGYPRPAAIYLERALKEKQ